MARTTRPWEMHTLFLPIVASALIAGVAWVTQAAVAAHYSGLTQADEQRIVHQMQEYSDKQFAIVRSDLSDIRQDLTSVLLELRKEQIANGPVAQ